MQIPNSISHDQIDYEPKINLRYSMLNKNTVLLLGSQKYLLE
jgi:hypothetical protein